MKVKITIDMNNASFDDGCANNELSTILKNVAETIASLPSSMRDDVFRTVLFDSNGNTVGSMHTVK